MEDISAKKAILVSIAERSSQVSECERSLDELERLLNTAGGESCAKVIQIKESYDPRTCIGSGKVAEIKDMCASLGSELIVFDFELTPAQIRNIEGDIGEVAAVIDRSMLILDIFALHAVSGEGKLQVELAQLRYSAPRIMGRGIELSRQGGGIGSRGPGESKLETDRRHMKERIYTLERRIEEMEHNRAVMRAQRDRSGLPKLALVGYTNAGKSTLLNRLTDAGVLAEDKLFATLDPTTRKLILPSGDTALLTDTVGFIRKLPHHLIKAFKSTLDEVRYADILIIVSDLSDPEMREQLAVTEQVIEELGGAGKPVIHVYNKADACEFVGYETDDDMTIAISAKDGMGVEELLRLIDKVVHESKKRCRLLIPYSAQHLVSSIYNTCKVHSADYVDDGVLIEADLDECEIGRLWKYIVE